MARRVLVTLVFVMFVAVLAATNADSADAHDYQSTNAHEWSQWHTVHPYSGNANKQVRHRHTDRGTTCEIRHANGTVERFKLISLNASNHDCTGLPRR